MANFAVIKNKIVINTIVANSKAIAEEVTGNTCIEYTNDNSPCIGLGYDGTTFERPAPLEISAEDIPTE
jgi:hypothetical protein